jgi:hypothetical protein
MRLRVNEMQASKQASKQARHFLTLNWRQVPSNGTVLALDSLFLALFKRYFLNSIECILSNGIINSNDADD